MVHGVPSPSQGNNTPGQQVSLSHTHTDTHSLSLSLSLSLCLSLSLSPSLSLSRTHTTRGPHKAAPCRASSFRQGQNLGLTVVHRLYSLDSGSVGIACLCSRDLLRIHGMYRVGLNHGRSLPRTIVALTCSSLALCSSRDQPSLALGLSLVKYFRSRRSFMSSPPWTP